MIHAHGNHAEGHIKHCFVRVEATMCSMVLQRMPLFILNIKIVGEGSQQ